MTGRSLVQRNVSVCDLEMSTMRRSASRMAVAPQEKVRKGGGVYLIR